jgi:ribosome-associated toxin RatA of RatAB toxin-antitoxin module
VTEFPLRDKDRDLLQKGEVVVFTHFPQKNALTAGVLVNTGPETLWEVITDYPHLPNFVPNLLESRVVKEGQPLHVFQKGKLNLPFLTLTAQALLEIQETPLKEAHFRALEGDFKVMEGYFRLHPEGNSQNCLLVYTALLVPRFSLAQSLLLNYLVRQVQEQLKAIKREAERRKRLQQEGSSHP